MNDQQGIVYTEMACHPCDGSVVFRAEAMASAPQPDPPMAMPLGIAELAVTYMSVRPGDDFVRYLLHTHEHV